MPPNRPVRGTLIALAAVAAAALVAATWPGARVDIAAGAVEIGRGAPPTWKPAAEGDTLGPGDAIRTGDDGRAEVAVAGATLRLYPNSLLRLPADAGETPVELDRGTSLFDVRPRSEPFRVRTTEVVVIVRGTRFAVTAGDDGDATVSVYRGRVGVRSGDDASAPETLVQAGFAAFGSDHFELTWHGADDPWEAWGAGEPAPSPGRGARRDAALHDARSAALLAAGSPGEAPPRSGPVSGADPSSAGIEPPAALADEGDLDDTVSQVLDPGLSGPEEVVVEPPAAPPDPETAPEPLANDDDRNDGLLAGLLGLLGLGR
jgi:ferric-dicitrate binding protein FerR (iron transport regulator)